MMLDLAQFSLKGTPHSRPSEGRKVLNLRGAAVPFIKGPVPLAWMKAAAMLPGKSLHAGLALWYLEGLEKAKTIALGNRLLGAHGHGALAARVWRPWRDTSVFGEESRSGTPLVP